MSDETMHWCGRDGRPLCGAISDETTRIREYYEDTFCKKCSERLEILDADVSFERELEDS